MTGRWRTNARGALLPLAHAPAFFLGAAFLMTFFTAGFFAADFFFGAFFGGMAGPLQRGAALKKFGVGLRVVRR